MFVSISDLMCHILQSNGDWLYLPVGNSAYYKSLETGSDIPFQEYHKLLNKYLVPIRPVNEISYTEFLELFVNITRGEFCIQEPHITVNKDLTVADGQHRLAILMYYYGPDTLLQIENEKVIGIWDKISASS
jgi:hypothetical protein